MLAGATGVATVRFLLAALLASALPAAAHAAPRYSEATLCKILVPCEPPAQYAAGPYLAPPIIRQVTLARIQTVCRNAGDASSGDLPGIMGCAAFEAGACVVHVPSDLKSTIPELYSVILRHELAHCRGWVHSDYAIAALP
jgi:hypothetical protein